MGCEDSRKLAAERSTEVLTTKREKKKKEQILSASALSSVFKFFVNVKSLHERCPAESRRQRISCFSKQIYIQGLRIKVSVSFPNCPFVFLSAGMVATVSKLRVLGLSSYGSGWWLLRCMCQHRGGGGGGLAMGECLWKDRRSSLGVGGSFGELEVWLPPDDFCFSCCSDAFSSF